MVFSVFACETVSGTNQGPLPCNLKSWSRTLNQVDDVKVSIPVGVLSSATKSEYRGLTEPGRMSLIVDWNGIPLAGGPIWTRPPDKSSVAINASGIRSLFARRKAIGSSAPYADQVITYTGVSLGTIASRLIALATDPSKPGARLPLALPPDEADGDADHERTYYGYELKTIVDLLANLTGVIGGPDIDFVPEWVDAARSAIRWRMLVGTETSPHITTANQLVWDYSAPEGAVKSLTVADDASQMATTTWSRGSGSEADTLIARSTSTDRTDQGWPLLEVETDYTSVVVQSTLDAYAAGDLVAAANPIEQYSMTVDALSYPELGTYALGDVASVRVKDHWWIEDSPAAGYGFRILGISGDASTDVKLTVQPTDARGLQIIGSPSEALPSRVARIERLLASE